MAELKLVMGNRNYSSWSYRAWLCLRKCEVEFEEVVLPLDTPEFQARIGEFSPTGKVPVLLHEGHCIWDSLAICEYANERFAAGRLWPQDHASRALGRSMVAEMHSGFNGLRSDLPMNFRAENRTVEISPGTRSDIDRVFALWQDSLTRHADDGPWLLGAFSIADAMFAPVVIRLGNYGISVPDTLCAYVEQHWSDPDVQRWAELAALETWVVEQDEAGV